MQNITFIFCEENVMIIDYRNYKNIDFKKYKRVFIFGCSFTKYSWPTWANILALETPDAEIYNFGQPGAGNLFISERTIAANQKFRFDKNDLVLVMWSTHSREDRYIEQGWETPGNIFTQGFYPEDYVKKYACVKGYVVRDLALMTMLKNSLDLLPCDAVMLKSVEPDYDRKLFSGYEFDELVELYRDVIYSMGLPLYHYVHNGQGGWINGHLYHWPSISYSSYDTPFQDYHPNPSMYMDFLLKSDFVISEKNQEIVKNYTEELKQLKDRDSIEKWFNKICSDNPKYHGSVHLI